ncbi:ATP-binding cassette, subfamily B [Clostridium collagenovorans DSM 3089]|uniref:ATP-binding cassette, subfamily B n=1 Tax=Clostridium collagenovorans DSM 3089 TaxID=1121306 RepID=A0A1M5X647_9CLOT|nr:ABC transporter ATP-binding protein [Clostridium collagenovorans]SHH94683.1 ATP-binding cassette, subfamily B [Clostridium collagenovorans DSM 3089]
MSFFTKYIKKYYKLFFLAIFCITLEVTSDLMQPTIMSKLVDDGVANGRLDYVLKLGSIMFGIALFGAIAAVTRNVVATRVAQDFGAELREDLFKKIQRLDFENIDKFDRASLITRLTNDVSNVQQFTYGLMRFFVRAPLIGIGAIIMAIRMDFKLSLILITIVPIIVVIVSISLKMGYPLFNRVQKAIDKMNMVTREYLRGVRVVKAFNRFDYERERFDAVNSGLTDQSIRAMRVMSIFNPTVTIIVNIGVVLILWFGGVRINSGTLEVGKIIAFTNYMTQLLFSLMSLVMIFTYLVRAKTSLARIAQVFSESPTIKEDIKRVIEHDLSGDLEFKNVSFSYSGLKGEPVLRNISFHVGKGETLGIIGSTGSGKTSLVNLTARFYDVNEGCILLDGVDVRDIAINELRSKLSVVPQRSVLFSGTIKDNVRWGKEDATEEEIIEVCKISSAHEFISKFKDGYESRIGQSGTNLSGGQKQRLSIARALIKKPEILILDDSTSAVDTATEFQIRADLKEYAQGLTTVIIAQRITSVMDADEIIVLDEGEIVGLGKHEELMKQCDVYKDIYKSQVGSKTVAS